MDIKRNGSQPSGKGQAEYFTGAVRIDPLFQAADPARAVGASVTFEPGTRTAWHTHPLGQTLIVTAGCGRVQRWGGPIEEIRPGDVIWFPPGEKHWHSEGSGSTDAEILSAAKDDRHDLQISGRLLPELTEGREQKEEKNMRATVYHGLGDMRIDQVPDPIIHASTDVVARITHAGICGSDLWSYRGIDQRKPGDRMGHEWIGIVEEVGAQVRSIKKGERVISPFLISDGTCEFCRAGLPSSCVHGERWGGPNDGGQGEAVRVPYADGTLVVLPPSVEGDEHLLKAILPLTDVMATGHHAAITAKVRAGSTVAVIGDGAVGLCGVLAAKRLGAERIFIIGHREQRLKLAQAFGATDVITTRDEQAVQEVLEQTHGGAEAVLECVGTLEAMNMALHMTRPGRSVSLVGFTHISQAPDLTHRLFQNITISGGVAPARAYLPALLQDVLAGKLDPSPVLDMTVDLDGVPAGYAAMDKRTAIKVMVLP